MGSLGARLVLFDRLSGLAVSIKTTVRLKINDGITRSPTGFVGSRVKSAADITVQRAKANVERFGRVDTGRMRDTIFAEPVKAGPGRMTAEVVAPVRYARFQHDGTRYITPAPFLTDAVESLRPSDFQGGT